MNVFTYILTLDTVLYAKEILGLQLTLEQIKKLEELENKIVSLISNQPNVKLETIKTEKLREEIENLVEKSSLSVISMDRLYVRNADDYIEVTRETDAFSGKTVGIMERGGKESLDSQIQKLSSRYKGQEICLADVGSYSGNDGLELIRRFRKNEIYTTKIINGIITKKAYERFVSNSINVKFVKKYDSIPIEWIEIRDFMGIDGRKIPLGYVKAFIPYVFNLKKWASLSEEIREPMMDIIYDVYSTLNLKVSDIGMPIPFLGSYINREVSDVLKLWETKIKE